MTNELLVRHTKLSLISTLLIQRETAIAFISQKVKKRRLQVSGEIFKLLDGRV